VRALLDGRFNASTDDIRDLALPALRHRLLLNFEALAEGVSTDAVITETIETLGNP
jgi:MoxR-like ATPase